MCKCLGVGINEDIALMVVLCVDGVLQNQLNDFTNCVSRLAKTMLTAASAREKLNGSVEMLSDNDHSEPM